MKPPSQDQPALGGGAAWATLAVLMAVYVINVIDRQILSILAQDIKADLGITDADLGYLYGTAFAIFFSLFGFEVRPHLALGWSFLACACLMGWRGCRVVFCVLVRCAAG